MARGTTTATLLVAQAQRRVAAAIAAVRRALAPPDGGDAQDVSGSALSEARHEALLLLDEIERALSLGQIEESESLSGELAESGDLSGEAHRLAAILCLEVHELVALHLALEEDAGDL